MLTHKSATRTKNIPIFAIFASFGVFRQREKNKSHKLKEGNDSHEYTNPNFNLDGRLCVRLILAVFARLLCALARSAGGRSNYTCYPGATPRRSLSRASPPAHTIRAVGDIFTPKSH